MRFRRFLRLPRSPERIRADVDAELRFDIEMQTQALVRQGLTAESARARAIAEFGDIEATRRYCADLDMGSEAARRRSHGFRDLRSDVVIAWRGMRRSPGFTLVVLATLALGIGATTSIFSVIRRVLITPLPFGEPGQLYRLYTSPATADRDDDKLSAVELADLASEGRSLAGITQFGNYGGMTYTDGAIAEPWQTVAVDPHFFDVLGIRPALGRSFSSGDIAEGAPRLVIIGDGLWRRLFGADSGVVGRRVQLNNLDYTILGVLPAAFVGPTFTADALVPLNTPGILRTARMSRARVWRSVVRLRDGVSRAAFEAELAALRPRIQSHYPEIRDAGVVRPIPLHTAMVGSAKPILLLVMAAAVLVLVVTCINIAGLFLSRAAGRRRELGLRAALGAERGRLIRQVLTESLIFGLAGGAAGVALAVAMKHAFIGVAGTALPQLGEVQIDLAVLAFAAFVSIACGFAFGLAPALSATRLDLRDAIGDTGGRAASQGRTTMRGARGLVAAQIAFAVVLVVGAGLLVRTFVGLVRTNPGYAVDDRTLTFRVNLPTARYGDAGARASFVESLVHEIHAMPEVGAVGYTAVSPWNGGLMSVGFRVEGRPTGHGNAPSIQYATASDELFSSLAIPLRAGRFFTPADRVGTPQVLIISERVARRFWPNANPIGARVRLGTGGAGDNSDAFEVVGVVGDVRPSVMADPLATLYVSERQWVGRGGEFIVRSASDAAALIPGIKQILRALDPQLPLILPRTLQEVVAGSVARQRLAMTLMGAFAGLALLISALGVYSVMAYAVLGRTREFGIRSALGAGRASILLLVFRQGLGTTVAGIAAGVLIAALLSRWVASLLVGVSTHDALTFTVAPIVLLVVATMASMIPARAATRVQPVEALRSD